MMIFPDIYLLSGFPFQIHQNVYGIDFPEENRMVLIDTGLDETDRIPDTGNHENMGIGEETNLRCVSDTCSF